MNVSVLLPESVQTEVVDVEKLTGNPELAVADNVYGDAPMTNALGGAKVMV